ncbi:hypothetical protein JZ751_013714 [Albula glossodonta]|uniref:UDP-glucose:glycoprotein glucosyltransferase 1 n=1 Tax=Albula glossodonta TaxID=121402 RepID=A0A8T2P1M8_9TELE|nr:hypothetical protein JZ751_013714 [Albula glossodonta]
MSALGIREAGGGSSHRMWVSAALLLVGSLVVTVSGDSKAITTTLTTKWASTPLLLEACEFFAEESQEKFWDFVELNQEMDDHDGTDLAYYDLIVKRAAQLLSPVQLNLLKFALSLRAYSATVHSFQQIASNEPPPPGCQAFFSVHGERTCSADRLKALLESASDRPRPLLFKGDHKFPTSNPDAPVAILYAENPSSGKVFLSGYGVELAIKNQEYKAKDDTQVQGADVNATLINENDSVDEVQGFLFGKLKTLYPELKEQLKELRKHLVESTNDMAPLKVWQMQDLSYQTAARILAAPSVDALTVMRDLSQNFPTKARSITKTVVNSEIRKEIEENQKVGVVLQGNLRPTAGRLCPFHQWTAHRPGRTGHLQVRAGERGLCECVWVWVWVCTYAHTCALTLSPPRSVFDVLRNEARVMEGLRSLLVETPFIHDILKLNVQPADSDYAVDIRSPAINWINNLETDGRYASWPSNVQELLRPTFPGVIRQIRKNFHNFVVIVDPAHENTAELLSVAEMFFSNNIPLRYVGPKSADCFMPLTPPRHSATLAGSYTNTRLCCVFDSIPAGEGLNFGSPSSDESLSILPVKHKMIGVVFVVSDAEDVNGMEDAGIALLRAFNYIADEVDNQHAFDAIISMFNKVPTGGKLKVEHVVSVLQKRYPYVEVSSILGADSAYDKNRKDGKAYYEQTGVGPLPVVLYNGMPYQREQLDPDELETVTMHKILDTTSFYQRAVYLGELSSDQDVVDFIMNQPNVVPRINSRILSTSRHYLDLSHTNNHFIDEYARFLFLDTKEKNTAVANSMNYMTKKGMATKDIYDNGTAPELACICECSSLGLDIQMNDSYIRPVTFWVVGDFDQPSGRQLLYDSIRHMKTSNNVRLGMINNPSDDPTSETSRIARAIWSAMQTQTANNAKNFITKLSKEETASALASGTDVSEFAVGGMDVALFKSAYESPKVDFLLSHAAYCRDVLKLKKGQRAVISNGRIIGPLEEGEVFNQDDFLLLESIILKTSGERIKNKIQQLSVEEDRIEYAFFEDRYSAVKLRPSEGEVYFDVVAVVDPVTRDAQKLAPFLMVLKKLVNVNLRVFMNCQSKLSDLPLKSFYRYVLEPEVSFMADNSFAPGPVAKFLDMPHTPLFTLNLNTPESWMVESVHTRYDLDNIYLEEVEGGVAAEYELEYLLLEGHCFDVTTGQPPRGLQFTLGTASDPVIVDTIVMANLGYFQLKANPGAWILKLRKGRSDDIYKVYSHEGTDSPSEADDLIVVLNNFKSKIIKVKGHRSRTEDILRFILGEEKQAWVSEAVDGGGVGEGGATEARFQDAGASLTHVRMGKESEQIGFARYRPQGSRLENIALTFGLVQKKPDKMSEELLSDGTQENDSGFWESLTRGFTGASKTDETKQEKDDVINIFSVASGHLYERFLRIMMLSVLKHTKTPVKFWFLKNYLSPTFKEFIPYMAEEYGFQYELVQYKWPRWLHQQTEKQRIIWGYKILFLDVLFPLAVDKILFVDADQSRRMRHRYITHQLCRSSGRPAAGSRHPLAGLQPRPFQREKEWNCDEFYIEKCAEKIVRTDLKELRDFDLEGAPYGYTPFCESRREMDGYRFWKSGYWASHLAGRKYHISALYVVDLKKFRKIAAGDRLRGQYQGLSQDPNSLSNLDQDLPNNMIHQVPIKSLPQEWLWCETWCDDTSKKKAKTIDLCNNPQTKEPKLQAAVRIVAEWSDYDQEIKRIYNKFLEEKEKGTISGINRTAQTGKSDDGLHTEL